MHVINIAGRRVGGGHPVFVIAEIGINHNGSLDIAKQLIEMAHDAGCDAVKFQKRTLEECYTPEELSQPRESPWGTTNGDQKRGLEFGLEEYREIDRICKDLGIAWSASPWDEKSVEFLMQFQLPFLKIPSARVRDEDRFLRYLRTTGLPLLMSTGACNDEHVRHAVDVLGEDDLILMHCILQYPCESEDLNLSMISVFRERYPNIPIGYSGHEKGPSPSLAAVALGACVIERHITLDRTMYGSDQAASLEKEGITRLVRDIRTFEKAKGSGVRAILPGEEKNWEKLRRKR